MTARGRSNMEKEVPQRQEVKEVFLECRSDRALVEADIPFFHIFCARSRTITELRIFVEEEVSGIVLGIGVLNGTDFSSFTMELKKGETRVIGPEGRAPVLMQEGDRVEIHANKDCVLWYSVVIR